MAVQSQLYNVQIGNAPAHGVEDLGKDLMGLMGATSKGAQVYEMVNVDTAKIEANDAIMRANDAITQQRILLNKYIESNNTNGILEVKSNIQNITASMYADGDKFKFNEKAFRAYSDMLGSYGSKVRETYEPMTSSAFIKADKINHKEKNNIMIEGFASSGTPILSKQRDEAISINNLKNFDSIENGLFRDSVFAHNYHLTNAELDKEPSYVLKTYNMITTDENGKKQYSLDAERNMLSALFGDLYTTDSNGLVVATKENNTPDAKEIDQLSAMLAQFRGRVTKKGEGLYSATWAKYHSDVSSIISSVEKGDISFSALEDSSAYKILNSIDRSTIGTGQEHEAEVLAIKMHDLRIENEGIIDYVSKKMEVGDYSSIDKAKSTGVEIKIGDYNVPMSGSRVTSIVSKFADNLDRKSMDAFRNGTVDSFMDKLQGYSNSYYNLTGKKLPMIVKAEDVISGGTSGMVSNNEYENSLKIMLQLSKSGQGIAPTTSGGKLVDKYEQELIDIEHLKEQYKGNSEGYKTALAKKRADGISDINNNYSINSVGFMSFAMESMDSVFNLGTAQNLTIKEANGMGMYAAKMGYRINTKDEAEAFINDNYTRTSMEYFGKATYRPKNINDLQAGEIIKNLTMTAKVKTDQTGYRVVFIPSSDKKHEWVTAKLLDRNGRAVVTKDFDTSTLSSMVDSSALDIMKPKTNYPEQQNTTLPPSVKERVKQTDEILKRYNMPKKGDMLAPPTLKKQ